MTRVFIDTDILLDLITGRHPFGIEAAPLFTLIDQELIGACVSSLSFSNLYYILRKFSSHQKVMDKLDLLDSMVEIQEVDGKMIKKALKSPFKDFEDAILRDIEQFIMELGIGFSFIARQKVIQIDGEDFKIDLLFYNRKLKQLVVIELKIGKFKASYKGQMELYLKWLEKNEKEEGEKSPIGIILCADKKNEQIELLELDKSNIHVAEYLTVLPPKELLAAKLHEALVYAREKHSIGQQEI